MARKENGIWHYLEKWREVFKKKLPLRWKGARLENGYCKDCRYCCGPQDSAAPYPMGIVKSQMRPDLAEDFYMLDHCTAYLADKGCKSDTELGCGLPLARRPVACGLFPLVLANGKLYLYQNCPAAIFTPLNRFYDLAREAAASLEQYDLEDLRRISLTLTPDALADHFIDLHVMVFDAEGKINFLE